VHHALSTVVVAIDGLAPVLTGQHYYSWGSDRRPAEALKAQEEKLARERGSLPLGVWQESRLDYAAAFVVNFWLSRKL
jgi:hypothetical protein